MHPTVHSDAIQLKTKTRKDPKNRIIMLLAVGMLATWGYFIWSTNNGNERKAELVKQYQAADSTKKQLQRSFDASLTRLDLLAGDNSALGEQLVESNSTITALKAQINGILNKQSISEQELQKAQELIVALNDKIRMLKQELVRLTQENEALADEKRAVSAERDIYKLETDSLAMLNEALIERVNIASTLNAYDIVVTPVNKKAGGKEKVTSKAKKVDKLVVSFDVDNRIAQTGSTEILILIIGPDGKPFRVESSDMNTFTSRDEGEKLYTAKIPVDIEAGKKKRVEFAWNKNESLKRGNYYFAIYHNGFKIGESVKELKKGGLLS